MAQNYQRHARGGGFKKDNIGDGGLRAYKEQQNQIINALKLQQARSAEYSKEYLTASKGVDQTEAENRRELQRLEDKVYQTKRGAIETRKRTEVDYWEGKQREFSKKADFWKDFSTTYSKQWGQLAQGVVDKVQMDEARAVHDQLMEHRVFDVLQGQNSELENLGIFNPIAEESSNITNNRNQLSEEKQEKLAYIESLIKRTNRFSANLIAQELRNNKSGLSDFIVRKYITEKEGNATASSINEAHRRALTEFLDRWNIKPGDGHREISDIFHQSGNLYAKGFAKRDLLRTNNKIKQDNVQEFYAIPKNAVDREQQMQKVYQRGINNIYSLSTSDGPEEESRIASIEKFALSIRGAFGSNKEWIDFVMSAGIVGSGGDDKTIPLTNSARFTGPNGPKAQKAYEDYLLAKATAEDAEQVKQELEFTTNKGIKELKSLNDTYLNEKNADGSPNDKYLNFESPDEKVRLAAWNEAVRILPGFRTYISQRPDANPHLALTKRMGLKPGSLNKSSVEYQVGSSLSSGDYNQVALLWPQLDKEQKEIFDDRWERLQKARNAGITDKKITTWATNIVNEDAGYAPDSAKHPSRILMAEHVRQVFWDRWNNEDIDSTSSHAKAASDIKKEIVKELTEGKGIYTKKTRKTGEHTKIEYVGLSGWNEDDKERTLTDGDIAEKIQSGTFTDEDTVGVISTEQARNLGVQLIKDRSIDVPESLKMISVQRSTPLSEVVNTALKGHGIKQKIRPDFHELAVNKFDKLSPGKSLKLAASEFIKATEYIDLLQQNSGTAEQFMSPNVRNVWNQK